MTEIQSDIILWKQFKLGSNEAFQRIYQQNFKLLYNYGLQIYPNQALVEDCIHELFVYLWKNKSTLGDTNSIKFYLFTSLRRKIIQEQKKTKKKEAEHHKNLDFEVVFLPEEQLIEDETSKIRQEELKKALNNLPARQKEVLLLLYFHNLSYEEVGQIMEINTRSVYTLTWKAITSLRKDLKQIHPSIFWWILPYLLYQNQEISEMIFNS
jgi:RNA polymerase sigma factor (sigma-70 family)